MDYFSILNLKQEPFSNSPDPDFFFHSREHQECLQKLELSIILRRGLNVIIGDVGTGKTTLLEALLPMLAAHPEGLAVEQDGQARGVVTAQSVIAALARHAGRDDKRVGRIRPG